MLANSLKVRSQAKILKILKGTEFLDSGSNFSLLLDFSFIIQKSDFLFEKSRKISKHHKKGHSGQLPKNNLIKQNFA